MLVQAVAPDARKSGEVGKRFQTLPEGTHLIMRFAGLPRQFGLRSENGPASFRPSRVGTGRTDDAVRLADFEEDGVRIGKFDPENGAGDLAGPRYGLVVWKVWRERVEDVFGAGDDDLMREIFGDYFKF